jgi:hypothetical protein
MDPGIFDTINCDAMTGDAKNMKKTSSVKLAYLV